MFNLIPWKRKRKEENGGEIATRESNPMARFREEVRTSTGSGRAGLL